MTLVPVECGVKLFVQDVGQGPAVVLIAGFGLTHEVWDREVRILAAHHRVICIDQRGHGASSKPYTGYDIPRLADDLLSVLDALEVQTCTLAGWSFGGQVAFKAAALSGEDRVERLVLVGSNGVRATRSGRFPFGRAAEDLEAPLIEAEITDRIAARRAALGSAAHRPLSDDALDWLLRCSLQMPSWSAVACYRSMLNTDLIDDIGSVTMPVLQIIGNADPVHSAKGARWLQQQLPHARLEVLDDCGHYPMLEAGDRFDELLMNFVGTA
jgi:pimeloyl-ACP methyl ester carboxylesterase